MQKTLLEDDIQELLVFLIQPTDPNMDEQDGSLADKRVYVKFAISPSESHKGLKRKVPKSWERRQPI